MRRGGGHTRALAALLLPLLAARTAGGGGACGVAQFACADGQCARGDAYCDGVAQCADGSDEPARCSPCNRTYHGEAGAAYALALPPPPPRAPFLCQLTFAAGGGALGDLVQLAFDEFRVGRFAAGARDGCPDGRVTLSELGRPFTGGSWCGAAAAGGALYYSEAAAVTLSVRLSRARLGEPFALRLRYRFLARRDAVVRYGAAAAPLERGAPAPGTYCTRSYDDCHRRPCRLQSPNYPGMYPRNVSCYWALRQRAVPTCKHAMISVRQEHAHKVHIKRSISMASVNKTGRAVRAWRECTGERDRLIFYDGASTDDPVLLEYCGGDWLPAVAARGPAMLVAFHASPYSAPPDARPPLAPLRGFELDVAVVFADSDSLDYAREARRCEFHVKASSSEEEWNATASGARGRRGRLRAPAHTLPPNTTCTWTFHGRPGDLVWIYFSSYTQYSLTGAEAEAEGAEGCAVELRIWDGAEELGRYCDAPPALCARAALANATRAPRPCAPPDGYVSRGALLAASAAVRAGTATHPLAFALHYEFVDARLPGEPLPGGEHGAAPAECARLVTAPGALASPRNALWFGRGGARRLRCVWRVAAPGAAVALRVLAAAFGRAPRCSTRADPRTGRAECAAEAGAEGAARLRLWDAPWPGVRVPLGCACDNASAPLAAAAWGGALELELEAALLPAEDHRHVHFRAEWERARAPPRCAERRRRAPPGEHLHLVFPYSGNEASECGATPFLLAARGNRSVLLRVWGRALSAEPSAEPEPACDTRNRVLVYDAAARLLAAVCPGLPHPGAAPLQLTSPDWAAPGAVPGPRRPPRAALLVVWAASEPGAARLAWMEVWRAPSPSPGGDAHNATAGCARACGALGACMPAALWCDGAADCPGGADEAGACGAAARLLAALGAPAAAGAAAAAAAALLLLLLLLLWRRRRAKPPARRLTEELLCDGSRASSAAS